jgi:trans-aconitate 2-methyltransferase
MNDWEPDLYLKFATERTQPTIDLVSRINLAEPERIIDVGCGPGNSTRVLRNRWPHAEIIGLDKSPEMIRAARTAFPGENWILADATTWKDVKPFDIVFSNAVFQWIPDHSHLINHWMSQVSRNGIMAFQVPAHYDSPVHQVILEVSRDPKWNKKMEAARNALTKEKPGFYYDLLRTIPSRIDIWETIYYHIVEGPNSIVEWFRGTGLRPYLDVLTKVEERHEFETMIKHGYTQKYPPQKDGKVLFPFKRLFVIAYK